VNRIAFRGQICPGEHPAILDRDLFEAVQQRLAEQHKGYHATAAGSEALLMGRIFDDRGNRMSPSHMVSGSAAAGARSAAVRWSMPQGEPPRLSVVPLSMPESSSRPPLLTLMPLAVAPTTPKWRRWFGVDIKRK
jgi:hypothetical protein